MTLIVIHFTTLYRYLTDVQKQIFHYLDLQLHGKSPSNIDIQQSTHENSSL